MCKTIIIILVISCFPQSVLAFDFLSTSKEIYRDALEWCQDKRLPICGDPMLSADKKFTNSIEKLKKQNENARKTFLSTAQDLRKILRSIHDAQGSNSQKFSDFFSGDGSYLQSTIEKAKIEMKDLDNKWYDRQNLLNDLKKQFDDVIYSANVFFSILEKMSSSIDDKRMSQKMRSMVDDVRRAYVQKSREAMSSINNVERAYVTMKDNISMARLTNVLSEYSELSISNDDVLKSADSSLILLAQFCQESQNIANNFKR